MRIILTDHICERYIERINPNLESVTDVNDRLTMAKKAITAILNDARYVSDDDRGILMRSEMFNCNIIIKDRKLITIYTLTNDRIKKKKLDAVHGN